MESEIIQIELHVHIHTYHQDYNLQNHTLMKHIIYGEQFVLLLQKIKDYKMSAFCL